MKKNNDDIDRITNQLFARFLCENGLITKDDVVVEYVRQLNDAVVIDEIFNNNPKIIYCDGVHESSTIHDHIINNFGLSDYRVNLISNAFNDRVASACKKLLPYGRFNIGICTDDVSEYSVGKLKLVRFAKELIATGIKVDSYENEYGGNKLYVLSNRRRLNGK